MEVRARKSPHEMPGPDDVTDLPVETEAWTTEQHQAMEAKLSASRRPATQQQNWQYPVKPLFLNDDDSDSDSEDEDDMSIMTTCCCCFSTRHGTIAVGAICLVISFCVSVATCFALINLDDIKYELENDYSYYKLRVTANLTANNYKLVDRLVGMQNILDNIQTIFIVILVFYALYTFSSLFLTYGACTSLRGLLLPWIVLEFVPFGAQLAGIIIIFVYGKDDPILSAGGTYIIAGLGQIVAFVIHVYWWMCPVAHYQNLKEDTKVETLVPPNHPSYPGFQKY